MKVTAYRTRVFTPGDNLNKCIEEAIPVIPEKSIVAVSSKIVALSQNRVRPIRTKKEKRKLIIEEAEYYLDDPLFSDYGIILTIKNGMLTVSAGIDESNGNGRYILWPHNPMKAAADIWQYLKTNHKVNNLGVVLTDSHSQPLRWGVTGCAIAWCGFKPLKDYRGKPDLFGRSFVFETTSMIDTAAQIGVAVMGEGNEQTPLSVIEQLPGVEYENHPPTPDEIGAIKITLEKDIYRPFLAAAEWKKGGSFSSSLL